MSLRYNTAGNVPIFKPSKITQIIVIEKRKKAKTKINVNTSKQKQKEANSTLPPFSLQSPLHR